MVLALLSGASPKTCKEGPVVRLPAGTWRLGVHGVVDSELSMNVEGQDFPVVIAHDHHIFIKEPRTIQLHFSNRGSEQYITALAERIHAA